MVTVLLWACGGATVDDAGAPDAGATDAGREDAGALDDAGAFEDAGALDDAGAFDDAGASDAGLTDDAGSDAGPSVDAGYQGTTEPLLPDGGSIVERLTPTVAFVFTEGPLWLVEQHVLLFSDVQDDRIRRYTPGAGFDDFRNPSGNSNGLSRDLTGAILACEHGNRRVSRTLPDAGTATLVDRFDGGRLNSPNDLIVRSDGTVYFTDPPYGVADNLRELSFQGVFRVDPQGALHLVADDMNRPNGIALSPDERLLYVADTADSLVRRYEVAADGTVSNPITFAQTGGGGDGMAVDLAGNLYVTCNAGVKMYRPDGGFIGTLAVPQEPANASFGDDDGRTLYLTARTGVYRVRLAVPGIP